MIDYDSLPPAQQRMILLQALREGEARLRTARDYVAMANDISMIARKLDELDRREREAQQEREIA